jgi:pyruvate dehydrogenase E1 component beta subunit
MTGVALGAAMTGLRPIHVHIRSDFMLLGMNQIANMISTVRYNSGGKVKVPLTIRAVVGRGWGQGAQHSKTLHNFFAHIPGLKVVMPATVQDAYTLLRGAIRDDNPVIVFEHRWLYDIDGEVDTGKLEPLGRSQVKKTGKDITVVSTSWMTVEAIKAAEVLEKKHKVSVEVVDVRSVVPLDSETIIGSVKKTGHCIVADYDWVFCGFSGELAAQVSYACHGQLKKPVERLGFQHVPCPTTRPLENMFYPSAVSIIRATENILGLSPADLSGEYFYSYENKFKGPF